MREINQIIVHCSATAEGRDYTVDDIQRWHRAQGWSDVGYHYVVYRDGTIAAGRAEATAGAHCKGYNAHSIGVCYVGGVAADGRTPRDTRTSMQKAALRRLLRTLAQRYPKATILGHHDLNAKKACPSFDAKTEYADL